MIQIGNMNKVFHLKSGDVTALDNVTLNIEDGMIYGVIGYSGAGKSTLVRCLNLLETPDDGTLSVGDSGVITLRGGKAYDAQGRKLTERKLGAMRRGIGMIFQHFNLLDRSTVFENIAYPLRYTGMKKADMEARVFELLDADNQVPEVENASVLQPDGHVQLEDVSFRYLPDRPLIEGLSLDVKPGQRIAIVGPTGCGKTTLINLLMRFYDVNGGSIKVSGTDIRDVTRASLRGSYGMVLQDTWLRAGTVRENIAYGKPDATMDEVIAAAKAAHAHSFIRRLPDGYDTVIAEDGGNISQGQKQLLCIARVMLCLPPMLILDEATSSIDTRTEVRIQKAFARMMQGRTSFIVAHRLSTIREADVILVMKDGHIVEQGSHDQLLAQGGFYAKLYNSQFEGVQT